MPTDNIFSALAKYNSATDENYLTESFVFLLNSLLEKEPAIGIQILNQLCVENNDFSFCIGESISISTQEVTEQGTPDIKISSLDKLIYIEVKDYSPVDPEQLKRYKKDLESHCKANKRLILLTRFPTDSSEHQDIPDKCVPWRGIYNWLANAKPQDPVSIYLIRSFKSFMEVKQMSMQKVGWEYINGVPAFNNLIDMIEVAIQGAQLKIHQKSAGWDFKGFYLENKEFWCGIYYTSSPEVVIFEIEDKKKFDAKLLATPSYSVREDKDTIWFRLPLEDTYFFSLDKDKQLEEIIKFAKTAYAEAQKMKVEE